MKSLLEIKTWKKCKQDRRLDPPNQPWRAVLQEGHPINKTYLYEVGRTEAQAKMRMLRSLRKFSVEISNVLKKFEGAFKARKERRDGE